LALLVALCLSLASVASASSVGPKAVSNPGSVKPGPAHSVQSPSLTCLYCGNTWFYYSDPNAWTINYGYAVTDSFTVSSPSTMTNDGIASWMISGDLMTGVDWSVGTSPFANNLGFGASSTTDYYMWTNDYGADVYVDRFDTTPVSLFPGNTYWLTLYNATSIYGEPVYWDENDGHSLAYDSYAGQIGSEAFDISGTQSTTPEPASLLLFGSGLLGLGGVIRRHLGR